ncbi:MAG: Vms1/Ankzf1 family peptidyl-tRNA hydrolase [Candidatus Nanohaloarchaea archaeon]
MKLPWENTELKEKIEQLEASLKEKEDKIEKLENMLQAEKKRRKKHTREKQEAQEKVNRLEDQLEGLEKSEEVEEDSKIKSESLSFESFRSGLKKLDSISSENEDLITVYSSGELSSHSELQQIKNSLPDKILRPLMNTDSLILFYDSDLGLTAFKVNSFYQEKFEVSKKFEVEELLDFISDRKQWAMVSRGDTKIYSEEDGKVEEIEALQSRINRQHGKGGFSQGRFERKRDEQVQQHLDQVEDALKDLEKLHILGEKGLCKDLPGKYVSGFDPNSSALNNFYMPRRLKISQV